jgi:hypothetical protein
MGIPKTVRNTVIGVVLLLVLLIGAGVGYTFFFGPTGKEAADTQSTTPAPSPSALPKASKPAADAPVGVSVSSLLSPVAPGSNTSVSIRTLPEAKCKIVVVYNNVPAVDSGLAPKAADEFGTASWTWKVSAAAPEGTWPVNITCERNGKSGFVRGDLVVSKKPVEE